jgi:hypothetical protein
MLGPGWMFRLNDLRLSRFVVRFLIRPQTASVELVHALCTALYCTCL